MPVSADLRYPERYHEVLGSRMAYVEYGTGDPIVFLHGNPTSSYFWRNVMPYLEGVGRLVAPDLIGMGDSSKFPDSGPNRYTFVEHRRYLDALLSDIGVEQNVTLVMHDWGSALGFDWANRHRQSIRGLVYMEAIVRPVTWDDWPEAARRVFQGFRSPAGESMVLDKNVFVERVLPGSVLFRLDDAEMEHYRRPYLSPGEDRRPTLTWPRQIPIEGEPADVTAVVADYAEFLMASPVPKLFVNADPGAILTGRQRDFCRSWPTSRRSRWRGTTSCRKTPPTRSARPSLSGTDRP